MRKSLEDFENEFEAKINVDYMPSSMLAMEEDAPFTDMYWNIKYKALEEYSKQEIGYYKEKSKE